MSQKGTRARTGTRAIIIISNYYIIIIIDYICNKILYNNNCNFIIGPIKDKLLPRIIKGFKI